MSTSTKRDREHYNAWRREDRRKKLEQARRLGVPAGVKHGAECYRTWRCPCTVCREDHARLERERRARHREQRRAVELQRLRQALEERARRARESC